MKKIMKFYDTDNDGCSYFFFELINILGISRRTMYRIISKYGIKSYRSFKNHSMYRLVDLIGLAHSKAFRKYVGRLKAENIRDDSDVPYGIVEKFYLDLPLSKLNLLLLRVEDAVRGNVFGLNAEELDNAIFSRLIPIITVDNEKYINPDFLYEFKRRHNDA